jgi:ribosomal-protein-alanine N-acetyltransferase
MNLPAFAPIELGACRLTPFTQGHLSDRYVSWLNDPEVVRYSEQRHHRHTAESCAAYFRSVSQSGDLFLAIEAADAALGHVGNMTVAFDRPNRSADVSIMLGEASARGRGIGAQAWCGIVDYLLAAGSQRRVTAGTMAPNLPMIALMRKSGMTIEAVRPRVFLREGEEVDLVLAARFAD